MAAYFAAVYPCPDFLVCAARPPCSTRTENIRRSEQYHRAPSLQSLGRLIALHLVQDWLVQFRGQQGRCCMGHPLGMKEPGWLVKKRDNHLNLSIAPTAERASFHCSAGLR